MFLFLGGVGVKVDGNVVAVSVFLLFFLYVVLVGICQLVSSSYTSGKISLVWILVFTLVTGCSLIWHATEILFPQFESFNYTSIINGSGSFKFTHTIDIKEGVGVKYHILYKYIKRNMLNSNKSGLIGITLCNIIEINT